MKQVGKVDYFDGIKRKLYFFVEGNDLVEEEGFYKAVSDDKIFYIFVTNLSEVPLDSEIGARYSDEEFAYDIGERYLLYATANILMEHRKENKQNVVGYKTIPRHGNVIYELEDVDFDILKLPRLDFAHVRSGSKKLATTAGFKKKSYITHWLLSGWTNSGKTNSAKVLLGVTIKGDENGSFAGGVVIDPHGEYYKDLKTLNSAGKPRVVHLTLNPDRTDPNARTLGMPLGMLSPYDLCEVKEFSQETQVPLMWVCRNYFRQIKRGELPDELNILKSSKNWIEMALNAPPELLSKLGSGYNDSASIKVLDAIKRRLKSIVAEDEGVWLREYTGVIDNIIKDVAKGTWYIFDVSSVSDQTTKLITSLVAYRLFRKYKEACIKSHDEWLKYKPAGLLVEEAHNYLSKEESGRGNIVAKIAKEGRKFKVFGIIVEQDPSGIDERVLKQVHNKITLQLIPKDARALCDTTPYIGELEKKIPFYETGEGVFVSTGSFNFALPVKFPKVEEWVENNTVKCKGCGETPVLNKDELCLKCGKKKKTEDAKAFM